MKMSRYQQKALTLSLMLCIFCVTQVIGAESEKFIVLSPPKCGTHLIAKALELILDKKADYQLCDLKPTKEMVQYTHEQTTNNRFIVAHNWTEKILSKLVQKKYKVLFILRDPRDQLLSLQNWFREGQWPWLRVSKISSIDEQIEELITGSRYGWRCFDGCIWRRYDLLKTLNPKKTYITRFEYLVGEKGNGSREIQITELINIASFLGVKLSVEKAEEIADQLFGGTGTFRVGQVGRWKKAFKPYHIEFYKSLYSKKLIKLGYEKDTNW